MNWYKKAIQFDKNIINNPDFIGFHCQKNPRSEYNDKILLNDEYADEYYLNILDGLPYALNEEMRFLNLLEKPQKYTDEFSQWANKCYEFFLKHNIRWIFVSEHKTLNEQYGENCYYVLMNKNDILNIINDINVNDTACAYVYDANKTTPNCIPIEDIEENQNELV